MARRNSLSERDRPHSWCAMAPALLWLASLLACMGSLVCSRTVSAAETPAATATQLPTNTAGVLARQTELAEQFSSNARTLAAAATTAGQAELATQIQQWVQPRSTDVLYIPRLPIEQRPVVAASAPRTPLQTAEDRWWQTREAYSAQLVELAAIAATLKQTTLAHELTLEAARQNPDDAALRERLGFMAYRGQWRSPYDVSQMSAGKVWDDRFGWVRSTYLPKYQQGLRYVGDLKINGRTPNPVWVTPEEDAELRSDIANGWEVDTEHYHVRTNVSLEETVRLAQQLEQLYWVWEHLFWQFAHAGDTPQRASGALKPRRPAFKHEVVCFRNKDEYVAELRSAAAGDITISSGIYFSAAKKAYFFFSDPRDDTTLWHEATHQLFSEFNPRVRNVNLKANFWEQRKGNFWIVEGIACYMETLQVRDDFFVIGGFQNDRFAAARHRAVELKWYRPLSQVTALGMMDLLRDKEIAALYSQAAGLTTFFMQAKQGQYRDALGEYLYDLYTGRDRPDSLERLMGADAATLDQEYQRFVAGAK